MKKSFFLLLFIQGYYLLYFSTTASAQDDADDDGDNSDNVQQSYLDLFDNLDNDGQNPTNSDSSSSVFRGIVLDQTSRSVEGFSTCCARNSTYYSFSPSCQKNVYLVEKILLAEKNASSLIARARELLNDPLVHPKVWLTAVYRVTLARDDLRGFRKPSPVEIMPGDFINNKVLEQAYEQDALRQSVNDNKCIILDEKFADGGSVEGKLWYFREDVQVNSHHWYWHIAYPSRSETHADRRGELFYYVHQSMLARYNAERLSNNLPLLNSKVELSSPNYIMADPYMPNLNGPNSGQTMAGRSKPTKLPASVVLRDTRLFYVYLNQTAESENRLIRSIDNGYLDTTFGPISLKTSDGFDKLLDTIEASVFSANLGRYGNLHNNGHLLIAFAHDPNNPDAVPSVMGDTATSMRDHIFYNWHETINQLCVRHKITLTPYRPTEGEHALSWTNVVIEDTKVYANANPDSTTNPAVNKLTTFWSQKQISLKAGLGFRRDRNLPPVRFCLKYLNHDNFRYEIKLRSNGPQTSTIRIFLAPKYDLNGARFSMEAQRRLFFVLDTFKVSLASGLNTITRNSTSSTLTIPWGDGLYEADQHSANQQTRPYCGCGWPSHLLLPKGSSAGMAFDLFVMATNGVEDASAYESTPPNQTSSYCHPASILCGFQNKKYPDLKPMGYPFDRSPFSITEQINDDDGSSSGGNSERVVANIEEYARFIPNAYTTEIVIQHVDETR